MSADPGGANEGGTPVPNDLRAMGAVLAEARRVVAELDRGRGWHAEDFDDLRAAVDAAAHIGATS